MVANLPLTSFDSLEQALKQFFGYDSFRPGQKAIVEAAIDDRDLLVIMPTGGGKSLCFQLPALLKTGVTIVISPLIALMQDQVEALQTNGIGATFLNSTVSGLEVRQRAQQLLSGETKLLYVAPERLLSQPFLEFLDRLHTEQGIAGFAIDEAHCVSEWGHDFRPEYRQLRSLRHRYADVPVLALTATATERVRQDILQQLELRQPVVHVASFNRQNLYYEVRPKQKQAYPELLRLVQQTAGSGIVYCLSRKKVDEITDRLQQDGVAALPYHAGLSDSARSEHQTRFIRDDVRVMVATIAFGMGINKPDVRFVAHYDLPRNLESYYQESGRAGRDGEMARCIVFFGYGDLKTIEYLIDQKPDPTEQQIARQQLRQVVDYAEGSECRRSIQLRYFGEHHEGNCGNCDNCLQPKPLVDWTIEAQKFLSCVARCQERFGMKYIIDVLRGSKDKRILANQHDQLSTYNIGRDHPADDWRVLGRSLLHQGLLEETRDGYAVLKLNALSWEVLSKKRTVQIVLPTRATVTDERDSPARVNAELLFDQLRSLRKQLADAQSVPPYVIFADSSLRLMAQQQPQSLEAFSNISGVGKHKLVQYGDRFVAAIRQFCQERGIPLQPADQRSSLALTASSAISAKPLLSDTHLHTLSLHQQGLTPEEIAAQRHLRLTTICEHLSLLLEAGQTIDLNALVPADRQAQILQAIATVGENSLRVIRDHLGETFTYDEICLMRAYWRCQNQ